MSTIKKEKKSIYDGIAVSPSGFVGFSGVALITSEPQVIIPKAKGDFELTTISNLRIQHSIHEPTDFGM
jgi:hypothetical protein